MTVSSLEAIAATIEDRRVRAEEYGKFRAKHAINIDGVRAFNAGDAVPVGHIERGIVDRADVTTDDDEAQAAAVDAGLVSPPRPKDSGSLADWQAFGAANGVSADELEGLSRDDLVARFPKGDA